jgi:hypothetical protein
MNYSIRIVFGGLLNPTIAIAMTMAMTSDKTAKSSEVLLLIVRCTIFLDDLR